MLQISTAKSVSHYDRFYCEGSRIETRSITVANAHTEHGKARMFVVPMDEQHTIRLARQYREAIRKEVTRPTEAS